MAAHWVFLSVKCESGFNDKRTKTQLYHIGLIITESEANVIKLQGGGEVTSFIDINGNTFSNKITQQWSNIKLCSPSSDSQQPNDWNFGHKNLHYKP